MTRVCASRKRVAITHARWDCAAADRADDNEGNSGSDESDESGDLEADALVGEACANEGEKLSCRPPIPWENDGDGTRHCAPTGYGDLEWSECDESHDCYPGDSETCASEVVIATCHNPSSRRSRHGARHLRARATGAFVGDLSSPIRALRHPTCRARWGRKRSDVRRRLGMTAVIEQACAHGFGMAAGIEEACAHGFGMAAVIEEACAHGFGMTAVIEEACAHGFGMTAGHRGGGRLHRTES